MTASAAPSNTLPAISAQRKRYAGQAVRRRESARAIPLTARDVAVQVGERLVPDPYAPGNFITATVNRRVDILAKDRGTGEITEAQFLVGRMIQAVYERASGARLGSAGWALGDERDQTVSHELQIILSIEDATTVQRFTRRLEQAIGVMPARFLRAVLCEGHTYTTYAQAHGRSGERAATDIAKRVRWLLALLTERDQTATGAEGQRIRATRSPA